MDDPFDEEPMPAVTRVRAGGRFQPRAKQTSVCSALPDDEKRKAVSQTSNDEQLIQPVDGRDGDKRTAGHPVDLSLHTSQIFGTKEGLNGNDSHVMHSEVAVSGGSGDFHSSAEGVSGENAGVFYGLECLNDFPSQSTCGTDAGDNVGIQAQSSPNSLAPMIHDTTQEDTCPDLFMTGDTGNCSEAAVFNNDGCTPFDSGRLETQVQQGGAFLDMDTLGFVSEEAIASGGHAVKYKPKPKVRTEKEKPSTDMPQPDAFESVMYPPNPQFVSSETACISEGSLPFFPPDDVLDYSSIDLGDIMPPDPTTSELPMNAEPTNLPETSYADTTTSEGVPQMMEKPPRKPIGVPEFVNEPHDEAHDNDSFCAELPDGTVGEDESNIDGHEGESKTKKKKAPRKSKKPVTENEKPVRKRKKANEASDQSSKEGPKKFSHSTRRKRRIVNKELLETPEDEIDPQKVPMKDLILLAEYRERLASKEAKTTTTPLTNQSTENYFHGENYYNEEQTFTSEQGDGSLGDQATNGTEVVSELYNYHSFMKNKTPTIRWSKQDTEVFYEAIRKFGTDLSTIQQLFFPERSRHQVKLKYKKEEREHPLRLTEALTNRAKDHSHFEKAIEQLKKVAAQAGQDTNGDDSIGMTGEEAEDLTAEINAEVEKTEQEENGEAADVAEVQSPPKADDESDDGMDFWDSYECKY